MVFKFYFSCRSSSIGHGPLPTNSEISGRIWVYFGFSLPSFSTVCLPRSTCQYDETTEKKSKSVLMCWVKLLGYLHVVGLLFVFLSGCRLFPLSKLILLPSVPAAFITMEAECFVQLSSTLLPANLSGGALWNKGMDHNIWDLIFCKNSIF